LAIQELTLNLRPDPVFSEDGSALSETEFSPGVGGLLRITGTNLDSVEISEISVTVGGKICESVIFTNDDVNTHVCEVPAEFPNDAEVKVAIYL
jgi:hypothetical protein